MTAKGEFGAAANGVSFGRHLTSIGADFVAMTSRTLGTNNPAPVIGPVVFSEIHFHPTNSYGSNNNAGEFILSGPRDDWEHASGDFDRLFGSNTKGAFLFGRAVAPIMIERGGGDIVNISTDHVEPGPGSRRHHGHGGMDLYNASKWALNGLTFDWATTLAKHHIRVNNICMGATDTEMLRGLLGPNPDPEFMATWMQPAQVAQVLIDLLAEGPDGRTGDNIGLYAGAECVLPPPNAQ